MSIYDKFNEQYGLNKKPLTHEQALTTAQLIVDEVNEFLAEFFTDTEYSICTATDNRQIPWPEIKCAAKELTDIRYITGQQMAEVGMNVDALDLEVHRSNMSKTVDAFSIQAELEGAYLRYPAVDKVEIKGKPGTYVMKCMDTGKVVKPTTTSNARVTPDMLGE